MNKSQIEWKELEFDTNYLISNDGQVFNRRWNRLLKSSNSYGYRRIGINRVLYQVHRLVAMTHLKKTDEKFDVVHHIDHDRSNNDISNLEWTTRVENSKEAHLGKSFTEEHKRNISAALIGHKQAIITCPYCGKTGGIAGMKRWHMDRCKQRENTNVL